MSEDSFIHDEATFDPVETPSGVEVNEAEAQYAELFREVIWDGMISAEERDRLNEAAKLFGLSAERVTKMEEALTAAYEAQHRVRVVDATEADGSAGEEQPIAPLAASKDPRFQALQRRITVVETRNEELRQENVELRERAGKLEDFVARLQLALEQNVEQLEQAKERLSSEGTAEPSDEGEGAEGDGESGPPRVSGLLRPRTMGDSFMRVPTSPAGDKPSGEAGTAPSRLDPTEIHRRVRNNPRDATLLRSLYAALQRADDLDRRWCIAHVLTYLGEANDEERALYEKHAPQHVVRPSRAVNKDEWSELLMHPDQDRLTGEILSDVAPAVLLGQMSALRKEGLSAPPDGAQEIDPRQSKLQPVRSLVWAAAFLGLKTPAVTIAPDEDSLIELDLVPKPLTRLGKQALVGRSSRELAFMAGWHLSWYRGEHILGKLTGSTRQLEDVFLAALMIGNPGLPMTDEVKRRVEPLARTIAPLLDTTAIEKLREYFAVFVEQGGRTNLGRWRRAADQTAACTGLLLANDLSAAEAILKLDDENKLAERMNELLVYFTAGRCSLLRKRIGIAIPTE
jgi:hypothetical protein